MRVFLRKVSYSPDLQVPFMYVPEEGQTPLWTRISWDTWSLSTLLNCLRGWDGWQPRCFTDTNWSVSISFWFLVPSFLFAFPYFVSSLLLGWSLAIPGRDPTPTPAAAQVTRLRPAHLRWP